MVLLGKKEEIILFLQERLPAKLGNSRISYAWVLGGRTNGQNMVRSRITKLWPKETTSDDSTVVIIIH